MNGSGAGVSATLSAGLKEDRLKDGLSQQDSKARPRQTTADAVMGLTAPALSSVENSNRT